MRLFFVVVVVVIVVATAGAVVVVVFWTASDRCPSDRCKEFDKELWRFHFEDGNGSVRLLRQGSIIPF